jgi:hypothetical protein
MHSTLKRDQAGSIQSNVASFSCALGAVMAVGKIENHVLRSNALSANNKGR